MEILHDSTAPTTRQHAPDHTGYRCRSGNLSARKYLQLYRVDHTTMRESVVCPKLDASFGVIAGIEEVLMNITGRPYRTNNAP